MINEMKNLLYYAQLNNYNCTSRYSVSKKYMGIPKIGTNIKLVGSRIYYCLDAIFQVWYNHKINGISFIMWHNSNKYSIELLIAIIPQINCIFLYITYA